MDPKMEKLKMEILKECDDRYYSKSDALKLVDSLNDIKRQLIPNAKFELMLDMLGRSNALQEEILKKDINTRTELATINTKLDTPLVKMSWSSYHFFTTAIGKLVLSFLMFVILMIVLLTLSVYNKDVSQIITNNTGAFLYGNATFSILSTLILGRRTKGGARNESSQNSKSNGRDAK